MTNIKRYSSFLLKLIVAAVLVYWLSNRGFLDLNVFKQLSFKSILICLGCTFITIFLNNIRWTILLNAQNFTVSTSQTLPLTFIGLFFNFAMPGGVGGDVIKGYYLLQNHQERKIQLAMSIVVDRIVGLLTMGLMATVAMSFNLNSTQRHIELLNLFYFLLFLYLLVVIFLVVSFSEKIFEALRAKLKWLPGHNLIFKVYEGFHSYRHSKVALLKCLGITLISQSFTILFFIYLNSQIGGDLISMKSLFWIIPVGIIATSLPVAPGGVGVGQAVFLVLFNWEIGHQSPLGPNLITASQISSFLFGFVGVYFYLKMKRPHGSR